MDWFRLAAQQGHPKSSYNLAIGHLSGLKTNLEVGFFTPQYKKKLNSISISSS